jgi:hypothetical protein
MAEGGNNAHNYGTDRDRCLFQRKKGRAIISARREYLPRNTALKGSSVTVKIFICRNKKCADILEG